MRAKNTLIMGALVVVLAAYVYFTEIRGSEERAEAELVADRLLRFESTEVTGLTIESGEGTISLTRTDGSWRITAPYELAADDTAVDGIVSALQSANHDRVIDEQPADLAPFGLDEPEVTATLTLADGSSRRLDLGAGTPVGFNVFVRPGDDGGVFTTAANVKDQVNKTLFDLRDRSILSFNENDIARLEIRAETLQTTLEKEPDQGDGIDRWRMREPLDTRADAETISSILNRMGSDRATAYPADAPTDEQLAEFGLVEPEMVVTAWTGEDAAHTLEIGAEAGEEDGRYARRRGNASVFVVPASLVDALPATADDLRNRTVVELERDRVESIELVRGDETIELEKDGLDWRIRQPRALEGDSSTVSALLSDTLGMRARAFAPEADASRYGFDDPYLTAVFYLEPGFDPDAGGTEPAPEERERPGEAVRIVIGDAAEIDDEPDDEGNAEKINARLVRVEGDPAIYYVAEEDIDDLDVDLFALRSKTVLSFTQSDLTRLDITAAGGTYRFEKGAEGTWGLTGPAAGVDVDTVVTDMLWDLNYLRMEDIVTEWQDTTAPSLAGYGLQDPPLRVTAYVGEQQVGTVNVGDEVPASEIGEAADFAPAAQTYATVDGINAVLRVDAKLRDALREILDAVS